MSTLFSCDAAPHGADFSHYWEHTVGSGHATLALRADWRAQLSRCRRELGFRYVRFHGILSDDMGTLTKQNETLLYSFHNADQIFDFLLSIGMRPFVELSFMPLALSSGAEAVFHYAGNVSPPRALTQWATLISKLVTHWCERYGVDEVRQWYFEVWNEPNLKAFWSGTQADYFNLYGCTARAIKAVDERLNVGGPATAANAWIADFLAFCARDRIVVDFISTHHYPTDAFGSPGDDTEAQLSKSHLGVLTAQAREVRRQVGACPVFYTEWSTSSNPRDPLHDEPYAAAYIVQTIMQQQGLVQGYSYWTFTDIFEENYFPSKTFQGGFGLMNIHGVPKPSYRAYEILHGLGSERLEVNGSHCTVEVWVVRGDSAITVLLTNLALPRHSIEPERVRIELDHVPAIGQAQLRRIDSHNANAKRCWLAQGSPDYPTVAQVRALQRSSQLRSRKQTFAQMSGSLSFELDMPAQSVAVVVLK
jgi:xylan 1,4-beta-xylosidase